MDAEKIVALIDQGLTAKQVRLALGASRKAMARAIRDEFHTDFAGLRRMCQQRKINLLFSSTIPTTRTSK